MAQVKITLDTFTTYIPEGSGKLYPKFSIDKYGKQAVSVFIIIAETENKTYTLSVSDNAKLSSKKVISYKAVEDYGTSRFDEIDPEISKKYSGKCIAIFNVFDYDLYTVVSTASKEDKYVTIVVSGDVFITDNEEIPITVEPFKTRELDYSKVVKLEYNYKPFNNFETTIPLFNDPVIGTKIKSEEDASLESILYATLSEELLTIYYGVYSEWIATFYLKNKTTGKILVEKTKVFKETESPKILHLTEYSEEPIIIETYIKYYDSFEEELIDTFTVYPASIAPIDLKHTPIIHNDDYAVKLEWTNITLYNLIYNIYKDDIKLDSFEGVNIKEYIDDTVFEGDGVHEYRIGIINPSDPNSLESMSLAYAFEIPKASSLSVFTYSINNTSGIITINHKLETEYKYKYSTNITGYKYKMDVERVNPLPYSTQELINTNKSTEIITISINGISSYLNSVTYVTPNNLIRITYGPCIVFKLLDYFGEPLIFNRLMDIYSGSGVPQTINIDSLNNNSYTYSYNTNIYSIKQQLLLFNDTGGPTGGIKLVSRSIKASDGSSVGVFTGQGFYDGNYVVTFDMDPYTKISELNYFLDYERDKFTNCCFQNPREFHPVKYVYNGILPFRNVISHVRKPNEVHITWENDNIDQTVTSITAYDFITKTVVKTVNNITDTKCDIGFVTIVPAPIPHLDLYFIATITSNGKSYVQDLGRFKVEVATTPPNLKISIGEQMGNKTFDVTVTEQNVSSGTYRKVSVNTWKMIGYDPEQFELAAFETLTELDMWENVTRLYLYNSNADTYTFSYGQLSPGLYRTEVTMVNAVKTSYFVNSILTKYV